MITLADSHQRIAINGLQTDKRMETDAIIVWCITVAAQNGLQTDKRMETDAIIV